MEGIKELLEKFLLDNSSNSNIVYNRSKIKSVTNKFFSTSRYSLNKLYFKDEIEKIIFGFKSDVFFTENEFYILRDKEIYIIKDVVNSPHPPPPFKKSIEDFFY